MKYLFSVCFFLFSICFTAPAIGQSNFSESVIKMSSKVQDVYGKVEDQLKAEFVKQQLTWPAQQMYLRSFKYDRQLEVWVKGAPNEAFKLFKTYKVCMQSGTMGPKRMEGDYQVPEGFYYINEFNPNSAYHLSLGLNYPNSSDRILSDANRPGSAIYIHGNCVSTGCIAISDAPIEELFALASSVKNQGQQDFIPVHVFPIRYNVPKSAAYLENMMKDNESLQQFNKSIKYAFDYFEQKKQLPIIMVNQQGDYVFASK